MSKKLREFEDDERDEMEEEVTASTTALGMNAWSHKDGGTLLDDQIGICHNCTRLEFCESEFGNVLAICDAFKLRLSGQNRIFKCNQHSPRGAMDVQDMFAIATVICLDEPKIKGFICKDSKLLPKKKAGF